VKILQWLPILLSFTPLLGLILLLSLPKEKERLHRMVAILGTLPPLILSFVVYGMMLQKEFHLSRSIEWFSIPSLQINFPFDGRIDGLSLPFIFLTCLLSTIAVIASFWIKKKTKEYYVLLLALESVMLGVFTSSNLLQFFIFFELTLIFTFFLTGIWGFTNKERAANHFLLYNGVGSGFMLFAFVGLTMVFHSPDFNLIREGLAQIMPQKGVLDPPISMLFWGIFLSLLVAFAIKLPMFPFHSWMVKVHTEAPIPVVIIHSGILLKMGAYGFIRFGVEMFPAYMKQVSFYLGVIGVICVLYGAILAFIEKDLKRILAYSSVSHMGILLLGIAALNHAGLQGAIFQSVSHGLISALLFYLVGSLYERTGTTRIDELGGLARSVPLFSGLLLIAGMALLGLPTLSGFISEFMVFLGFIKVMPTLACIAALGLILTAMYTLRAVMNISYGPIVDRFKEISDLRTKESVPMFILVGLIILIGVFPAVLGDPMQRTIHILISKIGG
jgi:NADH-quinone oxidoreductase subunit M